MTTYTKGTSIHDVKSFDRSIKVWIECKDHPESKWYTKNPWTSQWFSQPSNTTPFGSPKTECDCHVDNYILSHDYVVE